MHVSTTQAWSDELIRQTRQIFDLNCVPRNDKIHMKHIGSRFGYVPLNDWLNGSLKVVDRKTCEETVFANVDELIDAGWVVD